MKSLSLSLTLIFLGLVTGCSSSGTHLQSIQVTPANPSIAAGLTQQFKATGTFSNHSTQDLTNTATWSSTNSTVATIASGGLATSKTQGSSTIIATLAGVNGSSTLQVTAATLVSIAVTPAGASIPPGTLQQFKATGTLTDGTTSDLTSTATWSSSASAVASITADGLVTTKALGSATITAMSGTIGGNTLLTVSTPILSSIVIKDGNVTIAKTTTHQFTAVGTYNDGGTRDITDQVAWSSSQTVVATITPASGRATGLSLGMTTITATLGSLSGGATLDVTNATIATISVAPSSRSIAPLTNLTFTAVGVFSDASTQDITQDVTWGSSAGGVATISNAAGTAGVATAIGQGSASISASFGGVTGAAPLNVSSATVTSISLNPPTAVLVPGSILQMNAVANFSDATSQAINTAATWNSSATSVATVTSYGLVTGKSAGPAMVTAQLGSVTATANLTVESSPLSAIAITPANASTAEKTATHFTATGTFADGSTQNLTSSATWTSSSPSVATMSNLPGFKGAGTGVGPGIAPVTAVFAGQVGTASLTVTNATLTSITISPASPSIALGKLQQFKATGNFSDGTTQVLTNQVTWSSSNVNVAVIDPNGAALSTGVGTTTISATLNGVSDNTALTVQ